MFDHIQLPPEVEACLAGLKARIRRYVLWEGIALAVVVVGLYFWFSLGFDYAVFSVRRLEPPRWLRIGMDLAVLSGLAAVVLLLIVFRVFRSFRAKSLALLLEKRFPELGDRLVTAVELSEQPEKRSALTSAMVERTVLDATETLKRLDVGSVFDREPLRRTVSAAVVLLVSLIAFAAISPEVFARWRAGYIGLQDEYWPREVGLIATVLAQPGDRIKQFSPAGEYKHPRGSDLVLLFDVPAEKKIPDRVELTYRLANGRGYGRATCFSAGERRFKHAIDGLLEDADFWVTAGDYTNREAYRVQVVEPPRVDSLVAECLYPEHTRRQKLDDETGEPVREAITAQGTQLSLPAETDFILRAKSNKPLVRARLQYGPHELTLSPTEASLTTRSADGQADHIERIATEQVTKFFDAERREFAVPFVLSELATSAAKERIRRAGGVSPPLAPNAADVQGGSAAPPTGGLVSLVRQSVFVMPPDVALRIFLEDTDDILGAEPARITIHGIADNPPSITAELKGIGTSITRKAEIPIAALITDDYGIKDARFEFQVDDKEPWEVRPLSRSPQDEPREFHLQSNDSNLTERFEVLKMDLNVGQKLTLSIVAEDADSLNGPHVTRGQRFSFKVVSNEELLSLLYQRELNLRRRFEQIISEVKQTRGDLILHRTKADEAAKKSPDEKAKASELLNAVEASVIRSLHGIRKNSTETTSVEESFRDIREELLNNAVHTPQMLERIDEKIVNPLHALNTGDYPAVDEALGALKILLDDGREPLLGLDETITRLGTMLEQMDAILKEMQRLETFQEAIELLKSIIDQQQQLEERTKSERKKRRIQELKGLEDE